MEARKTDNIAQAIKALPYRKAPAGFSARVVARIAAQAETPWQELLLEQAGLLVAGWSGLLVSGAAWLAWEYWARLAAALLEPGGFTHLAGLAGAHAALAADKLAEWISFAARLLPGLPPWYETAAATLACSLIIVALRSGEGTRSALNVSK
jgi:hypothetical protein